MNAPSVAFGRFVIGILLGCVIGLFYGFLRPVQKGRAIFPDLIFTAFAGWVLIYYGFAVCRGDLRMGYLFATGAGAVGWDMSFGRWLRPVFCGFWGFMGRYLPPVKKFFKKVRNFIKFFFTTPKNGL